MTLELTFPRQKTETIKFKDKARKVATVAGNGTNDYSTPQVTKHRQQVKVKFPFKAPNQNALSPIIASKIHKLKGMRSSEANLC